MNERRYEIDPELLDINPTYKMGFKILNSAQLSNIFPTIENILDKLDIHRKHITNYMKNVEKNNRQYNLMFDNIYSILGKRGSGKTSVVFTLSEILKNDAAHKEDLVLPIIIPEIIPERTDIMGWILTILEDQIKEIESKVKSNRSYEGEENNLFFENCRFKENNNLRKSFEEVKKSFFSSRENNYTTDSFSDSINRSANKTKNGYQFSKNLSKFWGELCKAQKLIYNSKEEPLIYIIFDDVDLTPHIVVELFSTIMKYLAYPNIIVILTADEQLLEQVIYQKVEKEYYDSFENNSKVFNIKEIRNFWGDFIEDENQTARNKLIKAMTESYMNKVVPPSSRYYVLNFESCTEKKNLIQKVDNNKLISVEKGLCENIDKYIKNMGIVEKEKESFLFYKKNFIESYLIFFGTTCRQIMNECLIVEDFLTQLEKEDNDYENHGEIKIYQNKIFWQTQNFIKNTLKNLHHGLDNDEFIKKSFYFEKENWLFYIDYEYIRQLFFTQLKKAESTDEILEIIKNIIQVYHLYFFIENILLINKKYNDKKERTRVHGQRMLVKMLDNYTQKDSLIKLGEDDDNLKEFLYVYKDIFENPNFLQEYDVTKYYYVRQYLNLYKDKELTDSLQNEMKKWKFNHPKWFKSIIKAVVLAFSGAFCINEDNIFIYDEVAKLNLIGRTIPDSLLSVKNGIRKVIKNNIKKCNRIGYRVSKENIQDEIDRRIEKIREERYNIRYYKIQGSEDAQEFYDIIRDIYKVSGRYEDLFNVCKKIEKSFYEDNLNRENCLRIRREILEQFYRIIIKSYEIASEKGDERTGYYEDIFSTDRIILMKALDSMNGGIDIDYDDNVKRKLRNHIFNLVQLNIRYLEYIIQDAEEKGDSEALIDLKKNSRERESFVYEIYKMIQVMYREHSCNS